MGKVKDLTQKSQEKIRELLQFWELNIDYNFYEKDLDAQITPRTMVLSRPPAHYFMHFAIINDDIALLKDLCMQGADVNLSDIIEQKKTSPLQLASDYGRSNLVKILLEYGAKIENIQFNHSMNLFTQPLTFLWGISERIEGKTVNYPAVRCLINEVTQKPNQKKRY